MKIFIKSLLISAASMVFFAQASACKSDERLFEHALLAGEPVCIPENPRRVVALDMGAAEMTLLSNRQLVGTANWLLAEMSVLTPEFHGILPTVGNVGYPANLETIVQLKPDIILAVGQADGVSKAIDAVAAQKIAPIVLANPIIYDDWKLSSEFWAAALNETPLFERLLTNYQTRVDEVKAALGENGSQTVSIISSSAYGKSLWLKNTPPAAVISDIGLARPDAQNYDKESAKSVYKDVRYPMISEERLDLADADAIFVFSYPSHDEKGQKVQAKLLDKLKANPIWQSLDGVKKDRAFYVGGHWWRCNSYGLANRVLDDVAEHLAGKKTETIAIAYPIK